MILVAVAAIGPIMGGCGSSTDDDPKETTGRSTLQKIGLPVFVNSLTKAQYLARANKLCRRSWADMLNEFTYYRNRRNPNADQSRLFAYVSKESFLPHMQFWFDDISYLGAPRDEEVKVEDMLKALQWAVHSGQERRIPSASFLVAVFSSFNQLAREYGLDGCLVTKATL